MILKVKIKQYFKLGLITTFITYVAYAFFLLYFDPEVSYLISLSIGLFIQSVGQAKVVFNKDLNLMHFMKSFLLYTSYSIFYYCIFRVILLTLPAPAVLIPLITISICMPLHFIASNYVYSFKK
jgi:hypothetical protein